DVDFIFGLAPTTTLRKHVADLEASTTARLEASAKTGKVRMFKELVDGAASWSRVERIIARVEVGAQGADTRFIVTNLAGGKAKALYENVYCRRGAAENHIKSYKTHLAASRTSCTERRLPAVSACRRLLAHVGLRAAMPKRSSFAVALFEMLRLRLIKIAARGRDENPNPPAPADILPGPAHPAHRPQSHPGTRDMNDGAQTSRNKPADRNLQTPACHHDGAIPAPDEARGKHRNGDHSVASGRQKLIAVHQGG
ncbi:transposase, partial [Mesorhizobium sp. M0621]|uniref:transposase n=1 Tax=Mesorhizobium sp. M0621 TaxID=2956974 RepID=UPI00333CFC05